MPWAEESVQARCHSEGGNAMPRNIRTAAVLGAGTMGAQIAAHLANQGIPCLLLDIVPPDAAEGDRSRLARQALERLPKIKPSPIYNAVKLSLITPGNFEDDLPRVREEDLVIEAVVENLDIKSQLCQRVAPLLAPHAIASTNTSGIPIHKIAAGMPDAFRRRFLGTHFFNPPRYLYLLEVIPTPETDPEVVAAITEFGERVLGKGVVIAKDTPNFIGNRIGTYGLMESVRTMLAMGLRPDDVDAI